MSEPSSSPDDYLRRAVSARCEALAHQLLFGFLEEMAANSREEAAAHLEAAESWMKQYEAKKSGGPAEDRPADSQNELDLFDEQV